MTDISTGERTFQPATSEIGEARTFVSSQVQVDGDLADALMLVTSELASNAVLHARSPFVVRVEAMDGVVRVAVFDRSPQLPDRRPPGPESVSGRGLAIVTSLTTAWGVEVVDDGKWVWALVGAEPVD